MLTAVPLPRRAMIAAVAVVVCAVAGPVRAWEKWEPVPAADLARTAPLSPDGADAEVLSWVSALRYAFNVRNSITVTLEQTMRVKVYSQRGRDAVAEVHLPVVAGTKIEDVEARVVHPDGRIQQVADADIFERALVKGHGRNAKETSFALPGLEPGCVAEYRWLELHDSDFPSDILELARDLPVADHLIRLTPLDTRIARATMRYAFFNTPVATFESPRLGVYEFHARDLAPTSDEPAAPPTLRQEPWVLFYYTTHTTDDGSRLYWREVSEVICGAWNKHTKGSPAIAARARELVAGAATATDSLAALYAFCQTQLRNTDNPDNGLTAKERADHADIDNAARTLTDGIAPPEGIAATFGALAEQLGFETRLAYLGDRSVAALDPDILSMALATSAAVAVRVGSAWKLFKPGESYTPFGLLPSNLEGELAAIALDKGAGFITAPIAPAEQSCECRGGYITVGSDGSSEGWMRADLSGHRGEEARGELEGLSASARTKWERDWFAARLPGATLDSLEIQNATNPGADLVLIARARWDAPAEAPGGVVHMPVSVFEAGRAPAFTASERRANIFLSSTGVVRDSVVIELPEGATVEAVPGEASGTLGKLGEWRVAMHREASLLTASHTHWRYNREALAADYPAIKAGYDAMHEADAVMVPVRLPQLRSSK